MSADDIFHAETRAYGAPTIFGGSEGEGRTAMRRVVT